MRHGRQELSSPGARRGEGDHSKSPESWDLLVFTGAPRQRRRGRVRAQVEGGAGGGGGRRRAGCWRGEGVRSGPLAGGAPAPGSGRDAPEARQHDAAGRPGAGDSSLHRYLDGEFWSLKRAARAPGRLSALPAQVRVPEGTSHCTPGRASGCVCCARKQVPPDPTKMAARRSPRRRRAGDFVALRRRPLPSAPSYTESRDEPARPQRRTGMLGPERSFEPVS